MFLPLRGDKSTKTQLQFILNVLASASERQRDCLVTGGGQSSLQVSCRAYYSPTGGVLRREACSWELAAAHQQGRGAATQMLAEVSVLERLANHSLSGDQRGSSLSSNTLSAYPHTNAPSHVHTPAQSSKCLTNMRQPPLPLRWRMHKQVMKYRM